MKRIVESWGFDSEGIKIWVCKDPKQGHYSTNVAFVVAAQIKSLQVDFGGEE